MPTSEKLAKLIKSKWLVIMITDIPNLLNSFLNFLLTNMRFCKLHTFPRSIFDTLSVTLSFIRVPLPFRLFLTLSGQIRSPNFSASQMLNVFKVQLSPCIVKKVYKFMGGCLLEIFVR